jgi:Aerotolerance regulator N-terminal
VSFVHPLALLGLAAAAIPALLHLLERRIPPEVPFPAIRYLSDAERRSARRMRLRHLLLLILRTALIAAIVVAAARPLVPTHGLGKSTAFHAPTALVLILDNSPSSGVVVEGRPVLDRLKAVAHAALARAGPADKLWLMLADGVARAGSREALLAALDSARPDTRRLALVSATQRATAIVAAVPLPGREVEVVSDLQRTAMGDGTVPVPRGVRVLALAPPKAAPPNRGVATVQVAAGGLAVSVGGTPGTPPGPLTVRLRGRVIGRALVAPGGAATLPLPAVAPGWWSGDVELEADELRADDARRFVWRVAPPARVAAGPEVGSFLGAAISVLRDAGRLATGNEVTIGERPGQGPSVVLPPADPALVGPANRTLAGRGIAWRFAEPGTAGLITAPGLTELAGVAVTRRYRLIRAGGAGGGGGAGGDSAAVLATVNGEPWLVAAGNVVLLASRLDTAWTALPASPGFVPFVDELANRIVRGEAGVREAEGAPRAEFQVTGVDTVGATVFRIDPRESDLTAAPPSLVRRVLGAQLAGDAEFAAQAFAGPSLADASGLLLVLALLCAAIELVVATRTR